MGTSEPYCIELKNKIVENCRTSVTERYNIEHKKLADKYFSDLMDLSEALSAAMDECMEGYYNCLLASGIPTGGLGLLTQEQQDALDTCNQTLSQCSDAVSEDYSTELNKLIENYNREQKILYYRMMDTNNPYSELNDCYRKGKMVYDDCMERSVGPIQGDLGTRLIDSIFGTADTLLRGTSEVIDSIPRLPRDKQ